MALPFDLSLQNGILKHVWRDVCQGFRVTEGTGRLQESVDAFRRVRSLPKRYNEMQNVPTLPKSVDWTCNKWLRVAWYGVFQFLTSPEHPCPLVNGERLLLFFQAPHAISVTELRRPCSAPIFGIPPTQRRGIRWHTQLCFPVCGGSACGNRYRRVRRTTL